MTSVERGKPKAKYSGGLSFASYSLHPEGIKAGKEKKGSLGKVTYH